MTGVRCETEFHSTKVRVMRVSVIVCVLVLLVVSSEALALFSVLIAALPMISTTVTLLLVTEDRVGPGVYVTNPIKFVQELQRFGGEGSALQERPEMARPEDDEPVLEVHSHHHEPEELNQPPGQSSVEEHQEESACVESEEVTEKDSGCSLWFVVTTIIVSNAVTCLLTVYHFGRRFAKLKAKCLEIFLEAETGLLKREDCGNIVKVDLGNL